MKKTFLFLVLAIVFPFFTMSQGCLPNGYKLIQENNISILEFDKNAPEGIYLLQIYTSDKVIIRKVLKL